MDDEEHIVRNHGTIKFTRLDWRDHFDYFIRANWKKFLINFAAVFSILWFIIEVASHFNSGLDTNQNFVLQVLLTISLGYSLLWVSHDYRKREQIGLESESELIKQIAREKKLFWEYALAYNLIIDRIGKIDDRLDGILNNRIYVPISSTLDISEYIEWLGRRFPNIKNIVRTANILVVIELFDSISTLQIKDLSKVDYRILIRTVNRIKDLYNSAFEFEIEGKRIEIPEDFELVHEIQSEWISVFRKGVYQMLQILKSISERRNDDFSNVEGTIVFETLPRLEEYDNEMERLRLLLN